MMQISCQMCHKAWHGLQGVHYVVEMRVSLLSGDFHQSVRQVSGQLSEFIYKTAVILPSHGANLAPVDKNSRK